MVEEKHGPWTGKLSDQGLIDSPRSPAERAIFKRLFVDAGRRNGLIKTRDDGTIDFTDSQAVPWFFEQQLFPTISAQTAFSRAMLLRYERSKPSPPLPFQKRERQKA